MNVPVFTIKDDNGKELLSTNLSGGGLGKYLKAAASLRSVVPLARVFSKPLAEASGTRELALAVEQDVPVGEGKELSISAGASARLGVHEAGSEIFEGTDLQAAVTIPNGTTYTSLQLEALIKAALTGTTGRIGFGFSAGTAFRYGYFHPFDTVGDETKVGDAMKAMCAAAVFPSDADDLGRLAVGAFVSVAGEGELTISGEATLSSATNLLATPGLPIIGTAALTAGASVKVGAQWTVSGEFEMRVSRSDARTLQVAFYRRRGRTLSVSAKASAGLTATIRGRDMLATLMRAISSDPETDLLTLVNAGLEDESILAIQDAIAASIDRSLSVSAQLQVSLLRENEAVFAYEVDIDRLDDAGKAALGGALHGRLAKIGEAPAGGAIRMVSSAARQLRERKTSWKINLLGILNVASFVELVREGTVLFDPVSGALTAADKVSARRIRVKEMPLASDAEKLRRLLFESLMITAAYRASRVLGTSLTLTADQTYLEQRGRTKRQDLEDHYRALIALGLCDEHERDARLSTGTEFGASTFVIENSFDGAACDAMFLDADGTPHPVEHYEAIGRRSLLALIPAADPARAYRRAAIESDTMWARVRMAGAAIDTVLPGQIRDNPLRLAVVRGDVVTILWWAKAMSRAATELVAARTFIGQRDAASLAADPAFTRTRSSLSEALGKVVATTEARFDDPWDVLAMDAAAARLGRLESMIISTRVAVAYKEADAVAAPAPRSRGMRTIPGEAEAVRDWTAEERDVFARHVVNLRNGKLSTTGTFSSSAEQVAKIFNEFVPEYAAKQKGQPARVLFFAHGGLTEEAEGLLAVLRRRRFFEMNGIYPVYFVWETGLRDTVQDIVGAALPKRGERAAPTDLAIEKLARNGGRQVWSQMKKSAQRAADPDGGSRLVAELAGKLWKATRGTVEFHALGHSAGAIFHAFFLPLLVAQKPAGVPPVDVRTLHLLAPASTTELFKKRLKPLVGSGQPITSLTVYTMTDELEQDDSSVRPYGKSLLYLVTNAFEDAVPTPLLGLQKDLKQDLPLIRFFGLAGTEKVADIVFSTTAAAAPLNARSQSIRHGGFDNDIETMTSVVRRVLDVGDATPVVDYFEESVPGFERAPVGNAPPRSAGPRPTAARGGRKRSVKKASRPRRRA